MILKKNKEYALLGVGLVHCVYLDAEFCAPRLDMGIKSTDQCYVNFAPQVSLSA